MFKDIFDFPMKESTSIYGVAKLLLWFLPPLRAMEIWPCLPKRPTETSQLYTVKSLVFC